MAVIWLKPSDWIAEQTARVFLEKMRKIHQQPNVGRV